MKKEQVENDADFFGQIFASDYAQTPSSTAHNKQQGAKCILDILFQTCLVSSWLKAITELDAS